MEQLCNTKGRASAKRQVRLVSWYFLFCNVIPYFEYYYSCEDEIIGMSRVWDREKNLSPWQDSNLWLPKHWAGALSTEVWRTHGKRGHIPGSYLTLVLHTARISPPCVWDVIGSNPVGDSEFFFVSRSWHADYFIFTFLHLFLSLLKSCGCLLLFGLRNDATVNSFYVACTRCKQQ